MPIRTASSTVALTAAAAFALGTGAFAQTMVGPQEISDEDLPMVTEHCEMLAGEPATDDMAADAGTDGETAEVPGAADAPATDAPADGTTAGVDFDAITIEECQAAGLVPT